MLIRYYRFDSILFSDIHVQNLVMQFNMTVQYNSSSVRSIQRGASGVSGWEAQTMHVFSTTGGGQSNCSKREAVNGSSTHWVSEAANPLCQISSLNHRPITSAVPILRPDACHHAKHQCNRLKGISWAFEELQAAHALRPWKNPASRCNSKESRFQQQSPDRYVRLMEKRETQSNTWMKT